VSYDGPIELNQVYAYEPPDMPGHPEFGGLVRVTGLLYDPRTATTKIRARGAGGEYDMPEAVFRAAMRPAWDDAE
jgi:hypothetical protein